MKNSGTYRLGFLCALILFLCRCDSVEPEEIQEPFPEVSIEFVHITAGTFEMIDAAGDGLTDTQSGHTVTLTHDFIIGTYEVTQAEYLAFMSDNPSFFEGDTLLPVENVSWYDAIRFTNSLSRYAGLAQCYDFEGKVVDGGGNPYECEGYRLPTEAEWEYAARAGAETKFFFGNDEYALGQYAWYVPNAEIRTHRVGEKRPNEWGLYDVHGNVWEWVYDRYAPVEKSTDLMVDPVGPPSGEKRVKRSGSFDRTADYLRLDYRDGYVPEHAYFNFGFRVARTAR